MPRRSIPKDSISDRLAASDLHNLHASGLSDDIIADNLLYTERCAVKLATLLNQLPDRPPKQIPEHLRSGGMVIPFVDLNENSGFARVRPHRPRKRKGRPIKYEQPVGEVPRAYFPKTSRPKLRTSKSDVHITEGEKKL